MHLLPLRLSAGPGILRLLFTFSASSLRLSFAFLFAFSFACFFHSSLRLSFAFLSAFLQFHFALPSVCLSLCLHLAFHLPSPRALPNLFTFLALSSSFFFPLSSLSVSLRLQLPWCICLSFSLRPRSTLFSAKKKEVNNAYPYFLFPFSLPCSPIMVHLALFSPIKFLVAFPLPLFSSLGRNHRP